jgi:hypothetical protein
MWGFVSDAVSGETPGFAGFFRCLVSLFVSRDERDEKEPIVSGGETARIDVILEPRSLAGLPA